MIDQLWINPNFPWLCVVRMLFAFYLLDNDLKSNFLIKVEIKLIITKKKLMSTADYQLTVMPLFDIHKLAQRSTALWSTPFFFEISITDPTQEFQALLNSIKCYFIR